MIMTIGNTKGGVGKSTLAANLAVEAARRKRKTLLIDSDVQGSSIAWRAIREKNDIKAMSITTPTLHKDLKDLDFDFIIIDAGGRDSATFRSAVMASDLVVIPVVPSQYDLWAANDTLAILREARAFKDIQAYFLLNQIIPNTIIAREAKKAMEDLSEDAGLLTTIMYSRMAYKNSITAGKGVSEIEPKGKACSEIKSLYKEIISIGGRNGA